VIVVAKRNNTSKGLVEATGLGQDLCHALSSAVAALQQEAGDLKPPQG